MVKDLTSRVESARAHLHARTAEFGARLARSAEAGPLERPLKAARALLAWACGAPSPTFRLVLFALFALHVVTGLIAHAMWLDEAQAWLIVRDSATLADLFHNLRYEGHPAAWYLLLWPLKWLGWQPQWMQAAQGACVLSAAAVLIWRGPFSRLELILILLSFPLLFEFALKSRNYALGMLALFLFCASFVSRRPPWVLAAWIALMLNVHIFYGLMGGACVCAILVQRFCAGGLRATLSVSDIPAALIVTAGAALCVATIYPPEDLAFATGWRVDLDWPHVRTTLTALAALVVVPLRVGLEFWAAKVIAGGLVLAIALWHWRRAPHAAVLLGVSVFSILAFIHVKHGPEARHWTLLFVALLAAMWIARGESGPMGPALVPRGLFALILFIQAVTVIPYAVRDRFVPMAAGQDVARYLVSIGAESAPLFAPGGPRIVPVLAYLGAKSAFFGRGMREGSFIVWDLRWRQAFDRQGALDRAAATPGAVVVDCAMRFFERERTDPRPNEGPPPDSRLILWHRSPGEYDACSVYGFSPPPMVKPAR